jgi:hypothetical protein
MTTAQQALDNAIQQSLRNSEALRHGQLEPWETWGTAARWNPTHHWHHPTDDENWAPQ